MLQINENNEHCKFFFIILLIHFSSKDQTNHLLNGTLQSWRAENQRGEKSKQVILDAGFLKFYLAL